MESIWSAGVEMPHFKSIEGDIQTEVLIIGGGMAGILCAYFLQKNRVPYVLVEGKTICSGITKDTTAKITAQHGLIYHRLLKIAGYEKAKMYLDANQSAVQQFVKLCHGINCDLERKMAYVYSINDRKKLEKEADALCRLGVDTDISEKTKLPFYHVGAVGLAGQAQFHPLKFVAAIAKDLNIFEHSFVTELKEHEAVTANGKITFQKVIFATHFPIDNKHGMYYLKMYQHRSYVIALENGPQIDGMYVDEAMCGMSFRNYKNYLLIGGGDHRTGKMGGNWEELRKFAGQFYHDREERFCWATQDCMTLDEVPYIGRYSKNCAEYFVATGFNKWGMTSSMVAANLLTDQILNKKNPYAVVFDPSRSMLKPQLLVNGCTAVGNLLRISEKRCPHLGCALKWNAVEHSWDCTCHGSRFDEDGKVLDNPANGSLKEVTGKQN